MLHLDRKIRKAGALSAAALALAAGLAAGAPARADEHCYGDEATGLFIGLNAGFGGGMFEYRESTRTISEDAIGGAMGGLRFGYQFNRKLGLSVEGYGFGSTRDRDEDWGIGAGLIALTWHPRGGGFFIRGGLGVGGGDFLDPATDTLITIEERLAGMFSVGYDWQLSDSFLLGVSADGFGMSAGGESGHDEDQVGAGGVTVQCTWRL